MKRPYLKRTDIIRGLDIPFYGPGDVAASWDPAITGLVYADIYDAEKSSYGQSSSSLNTSDALYEGKWYWEFEIPSYGTPGPTFAITFQKDNGSTGIGLIRSTNYVQTAVTINEPTSLPWADGDIAMWALDLDVDPCLLWFGKNGVWDNAASPGGGVNPSISMDATDGIMFETRLENYSSHPSQIILKTGASPMNYPVPDGFAPGWYQNN